MAAPNLVRPRDIKGRTTPAGLTTSLSEVLANPDASGRVYRVNCVRAANRDTVSREVEVSFFRGGTHRYLLPPGAEVPAGSVFVVVVRDEIAYLEEGDALYARAEVGSQVDLLINWEEIS
jgi:hypothetical protein